MALDNGEHGQSGQGEQSQSWPPPQQPEWAQQERSDEPEEATVARPVSPPPPNFDNASSDDASQPSSDDDRTQAFSRSDVPYDASGQTPTEQMPTFPPPAPGAPYRPPEPQGFGSLAYPSSAPQTPPQQPYAPSAPPYQPGFQGYPPQAPGYGQPPYQGERGYPQQPYGPSQYGQYDQYGQYGQQQQYGQYAQQYGQYAQQQYGTYPPAAPPKKRSMWPWIGVVAVVVVAALVAASFVAKPQFLGFKKVLDHTAVEQQIEKAGYTNVVCNDGKNPTVKKGATFTCTADGGRTVTVTITSSDGHYAWSPSS
jgi:uncharacterized protein DUF4333